jgi:dihydroorotate dehydrogenase (fumarate)
MTTSALLRHRAGYARLLLGGLDEWMSGQGFTSLAQVRGLLAHSGWAAAAQDRTGYVRSLRAADRGERTW